MELPPHVLERAQRRDADAQAEFLRRCVRPVRGLIRRLGVASDSEDDLQEVLAHLLRVLPKFRTDGPAGLGTWVHTVVYRWMLMQKRKRRPELLPIHAADAIPDAAPDAQRILENRELGTLIERALSKLPEAQRRVFVMAQMYQMPLQEIAEAEGTALGTVKSRLHRARAELVTHLGPALDIALEEGSSHAVNG